MGFGGQWAMKAEEVALGEEVVDGGGLDSLGKWLVGIFAAGDDLHAEGKRDAGGSGTDAAEADEAECLARDFFLWRFPVGEVGAAGPFALANALGVAFDAAGVAQNMSEDHLGDRLGAVGGNVGYGDGAGSGGVEVHDVYAGGEDADVFELGEGSDGVCVEDDFVGQDDVGCRAPFDDFVESSAVVDGAVAKRAEGFPGEVSRVEGVSIENDDFHVEVWAGVWRHARCGGIALA